MTILHNNGANYVRLKLWVDLYDENGKPYGGGNNDYDTTLKLAKRAKKLGMKSWRSVFILWQEQTTGVTLTWQC